MDAITELARADQATAVLGKAGSFLLVPLYEPGPLPAPVLVEAARRGFHFSGVLAVRDDKPEAQCEPDLDSTYTCLQASLAFVVQVAHKIKRGHGDSVDWLERLYRLPDPRD
jgi:hypothetical protein